MMEQERNAFRSSQEAQEQFVNEISRTMAALAGRENLPGPAPGIPFSAATGREFGGANMVRLMLAGMEKGFADDRWLSFKQIEKLRQDNPELDLSIRKGERGTRVLWPQEVSFVINGRGEREIVTEKQAAALNQRMDGPEVRTGILYYPYTVFNAEQIRNFPPRAKTQGGPSPEETREFVDSFVASSGVQVVYDTAERPGAPRYSASSDSIVMAAPAADDGDGMRASMAKLREFFHATGHPDRENRIPPTVSAFHPMVLEEMRAEMFSLLSAQYLGLPKPEQAARNVDSWSRSLSGGDARVMFRAATEAGRILTTMHQFRRGEKPRAPWFPPQDQWELLQARQRERDEEAVFGMADAPKPDVRLASEEEDILMKARMILSDPELLERAL